MRCKYCYYGNYLDELEYISIETLTKTLDVVSKSFDKLRFVWHGGEPLLLPLSFYQQAVDLQKKYDVPITNSIQTNGTLLTDDHISFFKKNGFRIGLSYDGLSNSSFRQKTELVVSSINRLKNNHCRFGIIAVLTNTSYEDLIENYEHFKQVNVNVRFSYMYESGFAKVNEIFTPDINYIELLKKLFNYWILDSECQISVDPFESYVLSYYNIRSRVCESGSCMYRFFCVGPNGDIHPCGRMTSDDELGNIHDIDSIDEIFLSKKYEELVKSAMVRREKCKQCELFGKACHGGCNADAIAGGDIENNNHFNCIIKKELIKHIYKYMLDSNPVLNPVILKKIGKSI